MKLIHAHIFNPANSLFKSVRNNRSELHLVYCDNSENCDLYKKGQCIRRKTLGGYCQYGKNSIQQGHTKKARGFSKQILDWENKYKDIPKLTDPNKFDLALIGDYIYLPYAHINFSRDNNHVLAQFTAKSGFLGTEAFIHKDNWNIQNILHIVEHRPQALFGHEISSYQKEEVPKFINSLKNFSPQLYAELCIRKPYLVNIVQNYVGRTAVLKTLNPFEFIDHPGKNYAKKFIWDGEKLICENWFSLGSYNSGKFILYPDDKATIKVEKNEWVSENSILTI